MNNGDEMSPRTIYIIDDEPQLVELLTDVAQSLELKVHDYTNASQFFTEIEFFDVHSILVLDLQMPEMDGIEVMRRLAKMNMPPSLILISGQDISVLHAAEKLGQTHNLEIIESMSKPVSLAYFRQLLATHISCEKQNPDNSSTNHGYTPTIGELHNGIKNDQLILHYQPQIDIATNQIIGVEALVRWQHPVHGLIFPDQFIPFAEKNGLIGDLTHWVIDNVVRQEQEWDDDGIILTTSVNISAIDITSLTLPEHLAKLLHDNKLDPTRLILEVTESALMGELVTSLDILTRLRLKGNGLSIDDFGTGYSSLSQLHRVPFTELKIDRSFVINMNNDDEAQNIVDTCIILGHKLNMKVVAEGVETKAELDILKAMGCDIGQGYFFSRPVEPAQIKKLYQEMNQQL